VAAARLLRNLRAVMGDAPLSHVSYDGGELYA